MPTLLRTARLNLVATERRHLEGLRDLWTSGQVMAYVGFPNGLDPADLHLEACVSDSPETAPVGRGRGVHMAVELLDGTFIGEAKLGAPDEAGTCEPDVKLLPAWWRRGYGREAVSALVEETFRRWPACRRVQFTPNVDNRATQALYTAVGARRIGEGHDPAGSSPLRGFVGVRYLVLAIDRPPVRSRES